ncbi:cytochrome P450 [Amycolatopsis sp. WAC 04197]|uniref:cytochrome P450 n=1 Tax=Amycolatopsis sp. WAC 04197 TaxID=2203199 RepID=UPI000F76F6B3|nr:cytochrome P450 [Amycolatopsis sp. WAC 04197]RSN39694.1 cytochrome P450 [Amycolatopsis sp. WAC 04197]
MTRTVEKATGAVRQRVSSLTSIPLPHAVDRRWFGATWPVRELAPAPAGLKPVLGDAGAPLIGHTLDYMRFGRDFTLKRYEMYGPVSWMGSFGTRLVTITGPEATQIALVNKDKAFSSQEGWKFFIERFFERGLMLFDFGEHHLHRRIMQAAFTRDKLAGYVGQMGPVLREGVKAWGGSSKPRIYWSFKQLTLDVATRVFMGMRSGDDAEAINRAFVKSVRAGTALIRFPVPGGRWAAGLQGRKVLEDYFRANLPSKRKGDGEDLFSALCSATTEDGDQFTDTDVVNHMIFLMMAAHETATISAATVAYHLAKNPGWQERARQESLALGDEVPDIEALESLTTLDMIFKEALRLNAPSPSSARMTLKDTEVLGYFIPQGTLINVTPTANHFAPECWSDPMRFDPERFSEERREDKSHRYAWLPFGGGAHKCIGLYFATYEVKAALHEMLRAYRWSVPESYTARWDYTSLPIPADGMPIRLERR